MSTPLVFDPRIQSSPQIFPEQKQAMGLYSSDTTSSLGTDNYVTGIRVNAQGYANPIVRARLAQEPWMTLTCYQLYGKSISVFAGRSLE